MHRQSTVFYKTDNSPGWYIAKLTGDDSCLKEKCKLWATYKIVSSTECHRDTADAFPVNPEPYMTHLTSNWIYSKELNKWFLPEEVIPTPESECEVSDEIDIEPFMREEEKDVSCVRELYLEDLQRRNHDMVTILAGLRVKSEISSIVTEFGYSSEISSHFKAFLQSVRDNRYSYLILDEFSRTKILAWPTLDKCRVVFQDYNHYERVAEPLDILVDSGKFISALSSFIEKMDNEYTRIDRAVRACKD